MDPLNYTIFAGFTISAVGTVADALDSTDRRAGFMTTERFVAEAAINRYDFIRSSYIQYRKFLVNDGEITDDDLFDPYLDFENEPSH